MGALAAEKTMETICAMMCVTQHEYAVFPGCSGLYVSSGLPYKAFMFSQCTEYI